VSNVPERNNDRFVRVREGAIRGRAIMKPELRCSLKRDCDPLRAVAHWFHARRFRFVPSVFSYRRG
jgi:hypothetical protein